jgi:hypothetical protein
LVVMYEGGGGVSARERRADREAQIYTCLHTHIYIYHTHLEFGQFVSSGEEKRVEAHLMYLTMPHLDAGHDFCIGPVEDHLRY